MSAAPRFTPQSIARLSPTALLALALAAGMQAPATAQAWLRDVDDPSLQAVAIAVDSNGRTAVIRNSGNLGGVTLFDAEGNVIATYDLATYDNSEMVLYDGQFLDDDTLAVCGSVGDRPWAARIDAESGIPIWTNTQTDGSTTGFLQRMTVNQLGHVVCRGKLGYPTSSPFLTAIKPDNGGTAYRRYFGSWHLTSIATATNGEMLIASIHHGSVGVTRTSNWANALWSRSYATNDYVYRTQILEAANGELCSIGLIRNGLAMGLSQYAFSFSRFAADGTFLSRRNIGSFPTTQTGHPPNVANAAATADGGIVATVSQPMPGGTRDAALLRLDANGNVLWLRPFGKSNEDDTGAEVLVTPDGGFVALASFTGGGFRLMRADAAGDPGTCGLVSMSTSQLPTAATNQQSEAFAYTNYGGLWGDVNATPVAHSATATAVCGTDCSVTSTQYGTGTLGTAGVVPQIRIGDGVCLGYTPDVIIEDAIGSSIGLLLLSTGPSAIPVLGGTLLVDPNGLLTMPFALAGALGAPGQGHASLPLGVDLTPHAGQTFYLQAAILDTGAIGDLSATNGVSLSVH